MNKALNPLEPYLGMISQARIEAFIEKYVKDSHVAAIGTSALGDEFLKALAWKVEMHALNVCIVPTSVSQIALLQGRNVQTVSLNDREVDVAIEFADQVDEQFNYIKRDSTSLVRDKMIAQSAAELIVVCPEKGMVKRLHGMIPFEISTFGWKRTLVQLQMLGSVKHSLEEPKKTESGHYLAEASCDHLYPLEEFESMAKNIPGVLETGLFVGYADRIVSYNGMLRVKSRMHSTQSLSRTPH